MKKYKVKALKTFNDGFAKKTRTVNDVFTVDEERLDALKKASSPLVEVMNKEVIDDAEDTELQDVEETVVEATDEQDETRKPVEDDDTEDVEEKEEQEEADLDVKAVEDNTEYPLHVGGPYYLLSNGEQVKGKEAAAKAEKEL